MEGSSQNSFIPRNTARKSKAVGGVRRVYVFTYVSYTIFFGTLLAAAGVFLYESLLTAELNSTKTEIAQQQNNFNNDDLLLVQEFEQRIQFAEERFNAHVPVTGILAALGSVIADPVLFNNFTLDRQSNDTVTVSVTAQTDSFDSVRFQREAFAGNPVTRGAVTSDISITSSEEANSDTFSKVSFNVSFTPNPASIPTQQAVQPIPTEPLEENDAAEAGNLSGNQVLD